MNSRTRLRVALIVLMCMLAFGCSRRSSRSSTEMVTPKIHFILHCEASEYDFTDDEDFADLKEDEVFNEIYTSHLSMQPAGPTTGGLFSTNPGPHRDNATVLVVGTNFDVATTFNWVAADTLATGQTGPLGLADMQGRWVSENCVELVPPPSPIQASGSRNDGYVNITVANPNQSQLSDTFRGLWTENHGGAWLYVEPGSLTATAIALDSKLPTNGLVAPGTSGIPVLVTLANATTDDLVVRRGDLSFSSGTTSLDSFISDWADYRAHLGIGAGHHPDDDADPSSRLTVPAGGTVVLPFLVTIAQQFPSAATETSVDVAFTVAAESFFSKGEFTATTSATGLFRVAPIPMMQARGGDAWATNPGTTDDIWGGDGGAIGISEFDGTLTLGSGSASVSAPSLSGTNPSSNTWDTATTFPNSLRVTGTHTLDDDLISTDYIASDTVTIAGTLTANRDADGRAYSLQIGDAGDPAAVVVFDGATLTLRGDSDGQSSLNGNQGTYDGSGGSITIYTQRFVCVNSNIDLRPGDVTGGPNGGSVILGSAGGFTVVLGNSGTSAEISGSDFDLRGANSAGWAAGGGGVFSIVSDSNVTGGADVTVVNSTVNVSGGSSFGNSGHSMPGWVGNQFNSSFTAGNAGSIIIAYDTTPDQLGDVTLVASSTRPAMFIANGGHASTLTGSTNDTEGGDGGAIGIYGGEDIVIANANGAPGLAVDGGATGRTGGFGDNQDDDSGDVHGGDAGLITLGDTTDAGSLTIAAGSVLSAIGGASDAHGGDGGAIALACDQGSITVNGVLTTMGGFARESEKGNTGTGGAGGTVAIGCEDDSISLSSTSVVVFSGGSAALYGRPADHNWTLSVDVTAPNITGGNAGSLSIDARGGSDTDDGDVTLAGWIFGTGGNGLSTWGGGGVGAGGSVNVWTGVPASADEGDLTVSGRVCLLGGANFYSGVFFGPHGDFTAEVDGGSFTWSGVFEGRNLTVNDGFGVSSLNSADGDATFSGDFTYLTGRLDIEWRGRRVVISGPVGSELAEAYVYVENEIDTDGNNQTTTLSGTIWGQVEVYSSYDIALSGTTRSNNTNAFFGAYGYGNGGTTNSDPDINLTGAIRYPYLTGSAYVDLQAYEGTSSSTTAGNITISGVIESAQCYVGVFEEGSVSLNGTSMLFGYYFYAEAEVGNITLPSGRTIWVDNGTAEFDIAHNTSTAGVETITLAGTVQANYIGAYHDVSDNDGAVVVSGLLDASALSDTDDYIDGGEVYINLEGVLTLSGTIDVRGAPFNDSVNGSSTDRHGFGGEVYIYDTANVSGQGNWSLAGTIRADGGGDDTTVTPGFFVEGGAGGYVEIEHLGDDLTESFTLSTAISANGGASAHGPGGPGGVIVVGNVDGSDGGNLVLSGTITANGGASTFTAAGYGGNGGTLYYAGGEVQVGGSHSVNGGNGPAAGGNGGNVSVAANGHSAHTGTTSPITGSGSISAAGGSSTNNGFAGNGGSIFFDNETGVSTLTTLAANVSTNVSAGTGLGGQDGTVWREND